MSRKPQRSPLTQRQRQAQQNLQRLWNAKKNILGLTQEQVAHDYFEGRTQGLIGQYLRGNIALNPQAILRFSRALQVSPTEIDPAFDLLPSESHTEPSGRPSFRLVPLLRGMALLRGRGAGAVMEGRVMHSNYAQDWIPAPTSVSEDSFAVRIQGSSMEPQVSDGDIVIVDPEVPVKHGQLVIVQLPEGEEPICRQYLVEAGERYLKAANPNWPSPIRTFPEDAELLGVAVCKFTWLK